jgi:membrane-associated protein
VELIHWFIDFILHLDQHLGQLIGEYGGWTYLILFLIIFCETGLVVAPFLPGDSLLFAAGAFAAIGAFHVEQLWPLLASAAILGDSTNYWIGRFVGPKVFYQERSKLFNKKYLDRTHSFYERHGGKTVIIARFMPIIRTFAPFVAGIGAMRYLRFIIFSVSGTVLWISTFVFAGYFFGNIPFVKQNFTLVVMAVILLSIAPGIYHVVLHWWQKGKVPVRG